MYIVLPRNTECTKKLQKPYKKKLTRKKKSLPGLEMFSNTDNRIDSTRWTSLERSQSSSSSTVGTEFLGNRDDLNDTGNLSNTSLTIDSVASILVKTRRVVLELWNHYSI